MKNNYPKVSIITVNFNGKRHLKKLLDSVFCLNYPESKFEVILADNVSTDNSIEFVRKNYPKVKIIKNDINNYCKALNMGIEKANADYIALINNDLLLDKNWLNELVKVITKEKKIACVGSKVLNMAGKIQNAGHYELPNFYWGEQGAGKDRGEYNCIGEVTSLCGAAVLYRKAVFLEVGLFDEDFVMFGEDTDMSFRLRQRGYRLIFVPTSIAYHKFHGTADEELSRYYIERNRLLYLAKHYPHKLSNSLLGNGYFTAKGSVDSYAKIYSIFPDIIIKVVKTHPLDITNEVISELFEEISKIVNYENEVLAKEISKITEDRNKTYEIRNQILKELQHKNEEVAIQLVEKNGRINQLQQEIQGYINTLQDQEKELSSYKDELANLSGQLRSRMDEVLLKDGQLVEKNILIMRMKDDYKDISNQLHKRMNEALLKDSEIIEKKAEIDTLKKELFGLAEQIANSLVTIEETNTSLQDKEKELYAYKDELANLSGQLRSRMDEVLIKDGQLIEKDVQISHLHHEIQRYLNTLQEKNTQINQLLNTLQEKNTQINQLRHEIEAHLNTLQEMKKLLLSKDNEISNLKKELSGIYNSEGFRFILRPLWTIIWDARELLKLAKKKLSQIAWLIVSLLLTPFFVFLSLSFLFEYIAWIILKPLLRIVTPKRKSVPAIKREERISIVVPNYNGIDFLRECLPSVLCAEGFQDSQNEILIVDDGSIDGSVNFVKTCFPRVRMLQNKKNMGFGFTCNRGVRAAKNEIIVLINNDIVLTKGFLKPLIEHLRREDVFAVTPKLYGWDRESFVWGMHLGHFDKGYIRLWNEAETGNGDKVNQASPSIFAIGGAMVFRKEDFLWLGGFDEIYRPNCWEDIDISYRAWKRGLKVIYEPSSLMYHKGRATLSYERPKEIKNELLFTWKNITDPQILKSHLNLLPWNLYRNRLVFLKGFFWGLNHLPQTLLHRILERRFIVEPEDKKIFNKITLYYKNFIKRGFKHSYGERPNVLIISRFFPYPLNAGGKIRIHNLVKLLSDRYNFILLSLIDHENELKNIPELKKIFSEVYPIHTKSDLKIGFVSKMFYPQKYKFSLSYSQELIDKLKEIQETTPVDIFHIESNELLYLTDYIKHAPIVYTEHDISILNPGKSYYKRNGLFGSSVFDYLKRFHFHISKSKRLDSIITLSKEDEKILRAFFPRSDINLVPTAVDLKHFSLRSNLRETKKLIFVGHYRHYPNEDAIAFFVRKIFPLIRKRVPEAELLIVGSNPTPAVEGLSKKKNVILVGEVQDVKPYLDDAAVFVNSLRISAGIKGKVLEAMSCGVPVVSTKVGSSGIDAQPEKEILIADGPKAFANQVIRLLGDDKLRKGIIANARRLVESRYDWLDSANKLDMLYRGLSFDMEYENLGFSMTQRILDRVKNFVEQKIEQTNGDLTNAGRGPEELHLELTYSCNSKCIMCDLWDYSKRFPRLGHPELSSEEIKRFVEESRMLQKLKTVVFSGGEPFLRSDIANLSGFFTKQLPHSSIGILTNGVDTEAIVSKTKEILDRFQPKSLWLGSSLDGIGGGHDKIRGTEGAFLAFRETINRCKKELPQVKLSATFTLTPYNIDQLIPAKQFADNEGLEFYAQFVVPKEAREEFVWTPQNLNLVEKEIMQIINGIISNADQQALLGCIEKIKDKNLISQLYYWSHLLKYQTNPQRFFKKCVSGSKFAMFNPYGDLFFCPTHKRSFIGNVRKERFDDLWLSEKAEHTRSFIKDGNCHCWLVCIVFPVLEKALSK